MHISIYALALLASCLLIVLIDETLTWKFRVDAVFGDGDGVVVQLVL